MPSTRFQITAPPPDTHETVVLPEFSPTVKRIASPVVLGVTASVERAVDVPLVKLLAKVPTGHIAVDDALISAAVSR